MTERRYYTATTLDGYIADENDSLDWLFVQDQDAERAAQLRRVHQRHRRDRDGATTYEWVLAHLQKTGESWAYTQPCWVFTHADLELIADNVRFVSGKPDEHHEAIAAPPATRTSGSSAGETWPRSGPRPGCSTS